MKSSKKNKPDNEIQEQPQYISRRRAAKMVDACYRTIIRWEERGLLTSHKLPTGAVRLDLAEVKRVFAEARIAA